MCHVFLSFLQGETAFVIFCLTTLKMKPFQNGGYFLKESINFAPLREAPTEMGDQGFLVRRITYSVCFLSP